MRPPSRHLLMVPQILRAVAVLVILYLLIPYLVPVDWPAEAVNAWGSGYVTLASVAVGGICGIVTVSAGREVSRNFARTEAWSAEGGGE